MAVQELSTSISAHDERSVTDQLAIFGNAFDNLLSTATGEEYEAYRLDEVVVGAIAPIVSPQILPFPLRIESIQLTWAPLFPMNR